MQYFLVTNLFMYIYQKKYWYNVFVIIFSIQVVIFILKY